MQMLCKIIEMASFVSQGVATSVCAEDVKCSYKARRAFGVKILRDHTLFAVDYRRSAF
jgi:hypothetical protein